MIDHYRHAVIGIHLEEFGLELVAHADVHRHDLVGHAELFEQDGHLLAVGRWPVVQIDHALILRQLLSAYPGYSLATNRDGRTRSCRLTLSHERSRSPVRNPAAIG